MKWIIIDYVILFHAIFFFNYNVFLCVFSVGTYCNSASACFVASDGKNLRLYQAVVDARKLLDELSDPESSVSFM